MLPILAFLKLLNPKDYAIIALVAFCVILLSVIHFKDNSIKSLKQDVAAVTVDYKLCQVNTTTLTNSINTQNEMIARMAEDTKNNNTKMDSLNKKLTAQQENTKRILDEILNRPVPRDCDGAMKDLHDFAAEWAKEFTTK